MNGKELFHKRVQKAWKQAIPIIVMIARGGGTPLFVGAFFLSFLLGYRQLLLQLPPTFPVAFALGLLFAVLLTKGRVRTFLQPADPIFLLPAEAQMNRYFQASLIYSIIALLFPFLILASIAYPLYRLRMGDASSFLIFLLFLCGLKGINLLLSWLEDRLFLSSIWTVLRFLLNLWLVYFYLTLPTWGKVLVCLVPLLYLLSFRSRPVPATFPWMKLIEREEKTVNRYRNWASLFADLPQTLTSIKPRAWLVNRFKALFRKQPAFLYLFWHSFLRSETFVMFLRLQVWVILLFFCLPYIWVGLGLLILSLWFTFLQIQSLVALSRFPLWVHLYPLTKQDHQNASSRFAFWILLIQTGILAIGIFLTGFLTWREVFGFFVIGLILSWGMARRIRMIQ